MRCPCCGAAELIHDTRDMPYTYKGEATVIPAVVGEFCPACGEVVLNREHGDRYSELIGLFQRQVNAALLEQQQNRLPWQANSQCIGSCAGQAREPISQGAKSTGLLMHCSIEGFPATLRANRIGVLNEPIHRRLCCQGMNRRKAILKSRYTQSQSFLQQTLEVLYFALDIGLPGK